jgi:hypothetical protein
MVLTHVIALCKTMKSQDGQGAETMDAAAAGWHESARANVRCYQIVNIGSLEHLESLRVLLHSFVQHLTFNIGRTFTISDAL